MANERRKRQGRAVLLLAVLVVASASAVSTASAATQDGLTIPTSHPRIWWTPARLAQAKQWYAGNPFTPSSGDPLGSAFRYLMTGETSYARQAIGSLMGFTVPDNELNGVASDTYRWNDWPAVVFDWTYDLMTPEERTAFIDRYNRYVDIMRKKSWGGPGLEANNYYWGYWRNELNWAVASYYHNAMAPTFLSQALVTRWSNSFLPYTAGGGKGGVTQEGTQYGPYMLGYPVVPMTTAGLLGRDLLGETNFYKETVFALIYATTPAPTQGVGRYELFPFNDDETWMNRGSAASSYYGDFMRMVAGWWKDRPVGQYARRWLNAVNPSASRLAQAVDPGGAERTWNDLSLDYYAPGGGFLYARNAWSPQATVVNYQLGVPAGVGHAHLDAGSFQIRRGAAWLTRETVGYSDSIVGYGGGMVDVSRPVAHNSLLFNGLGQANAYRKGSPNIKRLESRADYTYANVDLSDAYRAVNSPRPERDDNPYASHVEREFVFVRPLETLVILDRMESSADDVAKTFLVHFEQAPAIQGTNTVVGVLGDQALRLTTLLPSAPSYRVVQEGSYGGSQHRLQVDTKGQRQSVFLHVLQAKDASGQNVDAQLAEDGATYTVTLQHPTAGTAVIVFNKGLTATGGQIGYSLAGRPATLTSFIDRVQGITVTDAGPLWEGVAAPAPQPAPAPAPAPQPDPTPEPAPAPAPAPVIPPGEAVSLYLEAESGIIVSAFQKGSDPQASGGAYLVTPAGTPVLAQGRTEVRIPVTISSDGFYYLWARILGPADDQDAVFIGLDGSFDRVFPGQLNAYAWVRVGKQAYRLAAGSHDIAIGHAEPQARVDVLLVTNDPALVPTGASAPVPAPTPAPSPAPAPEPTPDPAPQPEPEPTPAPQPDPAPAPAPEPAPAPQPQTFSRYLEAEAGAVVSAFQAGSDPRASAGAYLATPAGTSVLTQGRTEAQIPVTVPRGGSYYLWARILGSSDDQDAVFIGMDGSFDRVFPENHDAYEWVRGGRPYQLTPGAHQVTIGHAEPELRVDALLVTDDPAFMPAGVPNPVQTPPSANNQPPSAYASANQVTTSGRSVQLDGRRSTDPDGDALTYAWRQTVGPVAALSGAAAVTASFSAPAVQDLTDLRFVLTVSDGTLTATDYVIITVMPASEPEPEPSPKKDEPPDAATPSPGEPPVIEEIALKAVTQSRIVLLVTTDRPTLAHMDYGHSTTYGKVVETSAFHRTHTFVADRLATGSLYYFRVTVRDVDDEASVASNRAFATLEEQDLEAPGPIPDLAATDVSDLTAALAWTAAGDDGNRGTVTAYEVHLSREPLTEATAPFIRPLAGPAEPKAAGGRERLVLDPLTPSTAYFARVRARDESGTWGPWSNEAAFTTRPPLDRQPPRPTDVRVTDVSTDRATISWSTDEPADTRLEYGKGPGRFERDVREGGLTGAHTVVLTSLAQGTRYFVRIGSADAAGNLTSSDGHVFVTLTPDTNAPSRPSTLQVDAASPTAFELRWAASDDDRGVAGYTVLRDGAPIATVASSAYRDTGLAPGTGYTYTVRAQDAAGNVSVTSVAVTATTMALPPPPPAPPVPVDPPKPLNVQPDLIRLDGWPELQVRWTTATPAIGWIEHEVSGLGWISQSPASPLGTTHRAALRVDTRYRNYTLTLIIQDLVSGRKIRQPLPALW